MPTCRPRDKPPFGDKASGRTAISRYGHTTRFFTIVVNNAPRQPIKGAGRRQFRLRAAFCRSPCNAGMPAPVGICYETPVGALTPCRVHGATRRLRRKWRCRKWR